MAAALLNRLQLDLPFYLGDVLLLLFSRVHLLVQFMLDVHVDPVRVLHRYIDVLVTVDQVLDRVLTDVLDGDLERHHGHWLLHDFAHNRSLSDLLHDIFLLLLSIISLFTAVIQYVLFCLLLLLNDNVLLVLHGCFFV